MSPTSLIKLSDFYRDLQLKTKQASELEAFSFPGLPKNFDLDTDQMLYRGKVRDLIIDEEALFMFHSDRLSAFDRSIGLVPYKGVILAAISAFWFKHLDGSIPHHFLDLPHPRIIKAKKLRPLKVEVVIRGYLAGSMQRAYDEGIREFCGNLLPNNLKPYAKLQQPIITPTTKADVYEHDAEISAAQLIANSVVTAKQWQQIEDYTHKIFAIGQKVFADHGWTLVDTKYEFGVDEDNKVCLIDEVHTPDSSRLWKGQYEEGQEPEMFDKEIVRRFLKEKGFTGFGNVPSVPASLFIEMAQRYLVIAENLIGSPLQIDAASNTLPKG